MITFDDAENLADNIIPYLIAPRKGEGAESFIKRAGIKAANRYFKKAVMQAGGNLGGSAGAYGAVGLLNGLSTFLATGDAEKAIVSAGKSTAIQAISSKIPIAGGLLSIAEAVASGGDGDEAVMGAASSGILGAAGPAGWAAAAVPAIVGGVMGNIKSNKIPNRVVMNYDKDTNKYRVSFTGDVEKMRAQYRAMSPASKNKAAQVAKARGDYEDSRWNFSDEDMAQNIAPYLGDYSLDEVFSKAGKPGGAQSYASVGLSEDDVQSYQTSEFLSRPVDSFVPKKTQITGQGMKNWLVQGGLERAQRSDTKDVISAGLATKEQIDKYERGSDFSSGALNSNTASFINKARKNLDNSNQFNKAT